MVDRVVPVHLLQPNVCGVAPLGVCVRARGDRARVASGTAGTADGAATTATVHIKFTFHFRQRHLRCQMHCAIGCCFGRLGGSWAPPW
jgi:hypothetical protein